jgi:chitinase
MSARLSARQASRASAVTAVAALAIAGQAVVFSAQAASPTLTLNGVVDNQAGLSVSNIPSLQTNAEEAVYNNGVKMNPILDGTPRGYADGDAVSMGNLVRGTTYHLSVRWTDTSTGAVLAQTNTVDVTTPPSTDTTPPTAPTNIQFHKLADPSPGQVGISFTGSTDNVDPASNIQYVIRENGQVAGSDPYAQKGDKFTVTAIDRSNNATTSAEVTWDGTYSS